MDTYTIIFSVGGILGLVGFVALITFYDDLKKWVKSGILRWKKKGKSHSFDPHKLHNINYMFQDGEDTLIRKHKMELDELTKH
jgi:hypothetical protein